MRTSTKREVGAQAPFFGVDVKEIELLRTLEKVVWLYVADDVSLGDLINAANAIKADRRGRRKN
jgi:hypothetical protein